MVERIIGTGKGGRKGRGGREGEERRERKEGRGEGERVGEEQIVWSLRATLSFIDINMVDRFPLLCIS